MLSLLLLVQLSYSCSWPRIQVVDDCDKQSPKCRHYPVCSSISVVMIEVAVVIDTSSVWNIQASCREISLFILILLYGCRRLKLGIGCHFEESHSVLPLASVRVDYNNDSHG